MSKTELVERIQKIDPPSDRSAFLWGPRKAGKTTLLQQQFPEACWIDLLDYDLFLSLSQRPSSLRQILEAQLSKTVVIDEVQKVPNLMDEIHWLIENRGYQFILSLKQTIDIVALGPRKTIYEETYRIIKKESNPFLDSNVDTAEFKK